MMRIREGGKPLGRSGFSLFEFLVVRNAWAKASRFGSSHSAGISAVFAAGLMHFISYSNDPSVFLYLGNKSATTVGCVAGPCLTKQPNKQCTGPATHPTWFSFVE